MLPSLKDIKDYHGHNRAHLRRSVDIVRGLWKYTYTDTVNYDGPWNNITTHCRGIVYTADGALVHHPFDKFFNFGQCLAPDRTRIVSQDYWVTEKLDGVLVIPFLHNGDVVLTTRGSFKNEFTDLAGEVARKYALWSLDWGRYYHMFELVSPRFAVPGFLVTVYPEDDLVLIGLRDKQTGALVPPPVVVAYAERYGLHAYRIYGLDIDSVLEMRSRFDGSTEEGWVLITERGDMCKIKRTEYLSLLNTGKHTNVGALVDRMLAGTADEWIGSLPANYADSMRELRNVIEADYERLHAAVLEAYHGMASITDRKAFAKRALATPYAKYLFLLRDGRDIRELLMRNVVVR